jgi:small subunit ribosomal protein S18
MAGIKKQARKKPRINKNLKCSLCEEGVDEVSYKDTYRLSKFLSRRGKIIPKNRTGACAHHQTQIANAVKNARYMALIPYSSNI